MIHILLAVIYLSFISLGLPDSLLGSAWPMMYEQFQVPVSYAGIISMIIAMGTVISSLQSDRLTKKLGAGKITAISVATTAVALFGFSISHSFWLLCFWAIPYGLGAGSVDASLNNYVAIHYSSRHMSWLHCMWGVGTSIGPYIMSYALTGGHSWNLGYRIIAILQVILTTVLILSLPAWSKPERSNGYSLDKTKNQPLSLRQMMHIPGVKAVMVTFFCYSAVEQTAGLWAASYLVILRNISIETAASLASLFYIGITIGRAISGFMTIRFSDRAMARIGEGIILIGVIGIFLPLGNLVTFLGFILIGLGCAPIFPCMIHSTPSIFGEDKSQAIIGVQMASAYIGTCLMPPIFGWIANSISISLLPIYLIIFLIFMCVMYERLQRIHEHKENLA